MNMGEYLQVALLNATLRGVTFTALGSVYASLHTAEGADETNAAWYTTEVDSGTALGYVRMEIEDTDWSDPAGVSVTETTSNITWPAAGASWGSITHVAFWDDPDEGQGNLYYWMELPFPRTINNGDVFQLTAGNVTVELQ